MNTKNEWKQITTENGKVEFVNIVGILTKYYNLNSNAPKGKGQIFREKIIESNINDLKIFLKIFGEAEYIVVVEIKSNDKTEIDSWIHIDGIAKERQIIKRKGDLNHQIFKIVSLGDLYESHSEIVEKVPELVTA